MNEVLHISSGDHADKQLEQAGLAGEVLVWHDVLYEGPETLDGQPNKHSRTELAFWRK